MMSRKLCKVLMKVKLISVPLIPVLIRRLQPVEIVECTKTKKRPSATKFHIGLTVLIVAVIVYVSLLVRKTDLMPRIQDFYRDCNRSSELCDQEFFQYIVSYLIESPYSGVENYIQYTMAKSHLKPLVGVKSLQPEFGPVLNDVSSFKYPMGIKTCRYLNDSSNLFVAIISAAGNFEKRESIRKTWLQQFHQIQTENGLPISLSGYGFIVGQTKDENLQIRIEEESKIYSDILQVGIIDNYYNLTLKVVGLVNWLNNHCSGVDFVLKVDDDIFVNVRNLGAVMIKTLNRFEKIFYGSSNQRRKVERDGKWKISYKDWPWSKYPLYPSGGAVLLPGISIRPLLAAAQVVPYLPFEDTYLLGLCSEKADIKFHLTNRFFISGGYIGPCHVYNSITWSASSSENMKNSYKTTENFYKNVTRCIFTSRKGARRTVNPYDYFLKMN